MLQASAIKRQQSTESAVGPTWLAQQFSSNRGGQNMTRLFGPILAATTALVMPAIAATQSERIRGTIESVDQNSMTVHTLQGENLKISLNDETKYVTVEKSSLTNVAKGSFIGTATKGASDFQVALEVVIFPPSLRGTG